MPERRQGARVVLLAALLLAGCSSPPSHTSQPSVTFGPGAAAPVAGDAVSIDNFAFVPTTLTVRVGSTVTWTNHDEEPHTVAANDGSFHSPAMGSQGTYSHTFATAGKFDYVCSIHPYMHATVVVTV
jgi:plastocyanin